MTTQDIGFALNYTNLYLIDITPNGTSRTWARIGQGITSTGDESDEETEETYYYDGDGNADEDVTGVKIGTSFEGHRYHGNAAQDFIAGLRFKKGSDRITTMRHIAPDGTMAEGKVTIKEIKVTGGDANEKQTFSFTTTWKGMPNITPASAAAIPTAIAAQAVSVAAGETTAISATASPSGAAQSFAYASSDVEVATVDDAGNVKGVAAGECEVSIKSIVAPGVSTTVAVTVTAS